VIEESWLPRHIDIDQVSDEEIQDIGSSCRRITSKLSGKGELALEIGHKVRQKWWPRGSTITFPRCTSSALRMRLGEPLLIDHCLHGHDPSVWLVIADHPIGLWPNPERHLVLVE
jgi:hypothetical protein